MTDRHRARHYDIYPAFCNAASPTFNRWVKLTAADVHGLTSEPHFQGQNVYFHLNHPIRYVYLAGVVSTIEYIGARIILMTLDDGSGESIDVKLDRKLPPKPYSASSVHQPQQSNVQAYSHQEDDKSGNDSDDSQSDTDMKPDNNNRSSWSIQRTSTFSLAPVHPETSVSNIKVTASCSEPFCDDRQHLTIDGRSLRVGTLIKAKGTLTTFRSTMQLVLERASPILAADEEPRIWEEYTDFVMCVLRKPWALSDDEVLALEAASLAAARREAQVQQDERRQQKKRAHKLQARQERAERIEERAERKRQAMADELDGNPLDRPGWRPWPEIERRQADEVRARQNAKQLGRSGDYLRVQTLRKTHAARVDDN